MIKSLFKEKIRGLDFTMRDYSLNQSDGKGGYLSGYTVTPEKHLRKVLDEINTSPRSAFIDIGSGKGFAQVLARQYGFKDVAGIEYSERLCDIARQNMKRLKLEDVDVFCCDAAKFEGYDKYDVFYFANPFGMDLFCKVMKKIEASLGQNPRGISIAYYHPVCEEYFENSSLFRLKTVLYDNIRKYETKIYENTCP
jgi:SAM-dependent methyltransferase